MASTPCPHATNTASEFKAKIWPQGTPDGRKALSILHDHSLMTSPCTVVLAPGKGSKARMRRSMASAERDQSTALSDFSILWA
jgi:hypothetical protein